MKKIKDFFKNDRFASLCGVKLLEVSKGFAKASMEITDDHLNAVDTAHGGAIFTLADLTFAAAANSHGTVSVAINVSISFVKAAHKGTIFAEAKETSLNPKLATYDVTVTDQAGSLIATFHGMVYRKDQKIPET